MAKRGWNRIVRNINRSGEVLQAFKQSKQWWDLVLAYLGFKSLAYPYVFKTRNGKQIQLNSFHDLVTVWVIFFRHEYKIPEACETIVDAGANIGSFSIYASQYKPKKIFALEPFPETFSQLEKNINNNKLNELVQLNATALADITGSRNMDLQEGPSQSRGLLGNDDSNGLIVKTSTLEDFLNATGHSEIDLLKIDIEGGEHEVFLSSSDLTIQRCKNIAMEYHPNKPKNELFKRLQQANFKLISDFPISKASGVAHFKQLKGSSSSFLL